MTLNYRIFLFCALLFFSCERAYSEPGKKIQVLTIPKSGTHLISKAVDMIIKDDLGLSVQELIARYTSIHAVVDHLSPEYDHLKTDQSNDVIKVLLIRDLRDILLSQIAWIQDTQWWWMPPEQIQKFNQLAFDEKIEEAILLPDENYGVRWFAREALEWMHNPTVLVCRFEDLVGPKGGGSREK